MVLFGPMDLFNDRCQTSSLHVIRLQNSPRAG